MKKYIIAILFSVVAFAGYSQKSFYQPLTAGPSGPKINLDTVTNAGTSYLTSYIQARTAATSTVITVKVTKISGTVGGSIKLQGAIGVTNPPVTADFADIKTVDTQTSITAVTATDATATYTFRLNGNPYDYYRVSWTGSGTMAASMAAYVLVK